MVEDNASLAQAVSDTLRGSGFTMKVTYDGEAGLQEIAQHDYGVIYLGIFLPLKNGLDVIKEIPKEKLGNVVVFTWLPNTVIGEKVKAFGVHEHVVLKDLETIDNVVLVIEKKYKNCTVAPIGLPFGDE